MSADLISYNISTTGGASGSAILEAGTNKLLGIPACGIGLWGMANYLSKGIHTMWSSGRKLTFPSNANRRVNSNTTRFKSMAKHFILPQLQSDLAITDVKNKVSVIARPPKFRFVRYSKVRLAREHLGRRPV